MKAFGPDIGSWISEGRFRGRVNVFRRFLWFVTCVDTELLARCPASEQKKYASLGAAMLVSTLLAFLSGYIAVDYVIPEIGESGFFSAMGEEIAALSVALFWTLIIFNLQRFIITGSSRVSDTDSAGTAELVRSLPALVVSLTVGIAIALPLELALFKPEIDLHLSLRAEQERMEREERIDLASYDSLLRRCSEHYSLLRLGGQPPQPCLALPDAAAGPSEGGNPTAVPAEKNAAAAAPLPDQSQTAADQATLRAGLEDQLKEIEARKRHEREYISSGGGLVSRIAALFEATPSFAYSVLLIVVFVQLTPVLIKIMAPKSTYEYLVEMWNRVVLAHGGIHQTPDPANGGIEPRALAVYDAEGMARPVTLYHGAEQVAATVRQRMAQDKEALSVLRVRDARARMRRLEKLSRKD